MKVPKNKKLPFSTLILRGNATKRSQMTMRTPTSSTSLFYLSNSKPAFSLPDRNGSLKVI